MNRIVILSALLFVGSIYEASASTITVWGKNMGTTVTQTSSGTTYFIECDSWHRDEICYTIEGVKPASPQKMSVYRNGQVVLQDEGIISSKK